MRAIIKSAPAGIIGLICGILLKRYLQKKKKVNAQYRIEIKDVSNNVKANTFDTKRIDGKEISGEVRADVKRLGAQLLAETGVRPGLAVILVGTQKDSQTYVRNKKKAAAEVEFHTVDVDLPDTVSQEDLLAEIEKLNANPAVHAILVQLPLPKHIDEYTILKAIRVDKDADGFSAVNIGNLCLKGGRPPLAIPCTPAGCIELLQRSQVEISGKKAVVVGRSNIVGMPVAALLQSMDATVTVVHSRTKDIEAEIRRADIVVAAIGKAQFVRGDWLKPGCVVIDVGINAVDDASKKLGYRLVGDVDFDGAQGVASQITPVPGGVGPMTIAMLLKNTLNLARHSCELERVPLRKKSSDKVDVQAKQESGGMQPKQELGEAIVKLACAKNADIWKQAVAMGDLREKMQQMSNSNMLPAVIAELPSANSSPVSLVAVDPEGRQVRALCSGGNAAEVSTALSA